MYWCWCWLRRLKQFFYFMSNSSLQLRTDVNSTDGTKLAIISCSTTYTIVYGNILLIVLLLNDLQSIKENSSTIFQR